MAPPTLATWHDVLTALDRLEGSGPLTIDGPWSPGQALAHCAQSIEFSLSSFPVLKPWLLRVTVGKLVKGRFLSRGAMSHDLTAPVPGAAPLPPTTDTEGFSRLRQAVAEFRKFHGEPAPHPVYGPCSRQEFEKLHAIHLADHLRAFRFAW